MTTNIDTLALHARLLPGVAQELVSLIGMEKTLRLVTVLGGTTFPIPRYPNKQGKVRFEILSELIGIQAAEKVLAAFSGSRVYIPNCKMALASIRNLTIIEEYDKRRKKGEMARDIILDIAVRFRLTERSVWEIVSKNTQDNLLKKMSQSGLLEVWKNF